MKTILFILTFFIFFDNAKVETSLPYNLLDAIIKKEILRPIDICKEIIIIDTFGLLPMGEHNIDDKIVRVYHERTISPNDKMPVFFVSNITTTDNYFIVALIRRQNGQTFVYFFEINGSDCKVVKRIIGYE